MCWLFQTMVLEWKSLPLSVANQFAIILGVASLPTICIVATSSFGTTMDSSICLFGPEAIESHIEIVFF